MYENMSPRRETKIVGNDYAQDSNASFRAEVKGVFEQYSAGGHTLTDSFNHLMTSPTHRDQFVASVLESVANDPAFTSKEVMSSPFYNNYYDRVEALENNSITAIARESAMTGYAPIVAYNPFFIKNQWVNCVFKDVVMTEIPDSGVINIGYQKRFVKDLQGNMYEIPHAQFDDETMKKLMGESTGLAFKEDPITLPLANEDLLQDKYVPGIVVTDRSETLTQDFQIFKVVFEDSAGKEHEQPCDFKIDLTHYTIINSAGQGNLIYSVRDASGNVTEVLEDNLMGQVDFERGTMSCVSTTGKIKKICIRGKIANRWNERSLDVVRKNITITHYIPESGPRFNSTVTVEDATDALILQNVDMIADNIDVMGRTLGEFEDFEIRNYLNESFENEKNREIPIHGYEKMVVEGSFDALPYEGYTGKVTEWMPESREWFERIIAQLKTILRSTEITFTMVCHPNLVRFLQNGINWVFSNDTTVGGVRLSYNFGVVTSATDHIHVITSMYMNEDAGIRFVAIPLTKELVTFKHYKLNTVIDRNYRSPLHSLVPNIMVTHRTLTFDVFPVQGNMKINGRSLFSPQTLVRKTADTGTGTTPGGTDAGDTP